MLTESATAAGGAPFRDSLDTSGRSICTMPAQPSAITGADVFLLQGPFFPFANRGDAGYRDSIPTTEEVT